MPLVYLLQPRRLQDYGIALLRVALGVVFLAHSILLKLFIFTLPGTATFFEGLGLPRWLGYVVFAAEAVGGIFLLLGIHARWAALALLPIALGAIWAHWGNGWMFGYANGGWEYPAYLAVLCIVQFMLGDGAFALRRSCRIEGPYACRRPADA